MENNNSLVLLLIVLAIAVFVMVYVRKHFKALNLPCVFFVSGAVKSGKSLLSVHLAIKEYKRALRNWKIRKWIVKMLFPKIYHEKYDLYDEWARSDFDELEQPLNFDYETVEFPPMLYSNIPLAYVKYNKLTIDIIERTKRIPKKSVVLIDEVSLFADSQLFKDKQLNNKLMAFYKLFGHYSHGGKLIVDSQSISDNHFSMKRCMSQYLYIYDRKKYPFFTILYVREMVYSDDNSTINVVDKDLELDLRKVLIFNNTYNKYDCYCYSVFTDYLPYEVRYDVEIKNKHDSLKCSHVVTLNEFVMEMNQAYENHLLQIGVVKEVTDNENQEKD